jgi:hypothetical protein
MTTRTVVWSDEFTAPRTITNTEWVSAGVAEGSFGSVYYISDWTGDPQQSGGGILYSENWMGERNAGIWTGQWDPWPMPPVLGPGTFSVPVTAGQGASIEFVCTVPVDLFDVKLGLEGIFGTRWDSTYWGCLFDDGMIYYYAPGQSDVEHLLDYSGAKYSKYRLDYYNGNIQLVANDAVIVALTVPHVDTTVNAMRVSVVTQTGASSFGISRFTVYVSSPAQPELDPYFWTRLTATVRENLK